MAIPRIDTAEFLLSAHNPSQFPRETLPEAAFLGRSNVGKSSLINALLGRRRLVRTSATPGCTRSLNFFVINRCWYFVDLPGFGYAAVSRKRREEWGQLVLNYLDNRSTLQAVVFLQDGRRLPGPEELFLWERLRSRGRVVLPVLTKADKLNRRERTRQLQDIAGALAPLGLAAPDFIWFSALTHEGRDRLWARLRACLGQVNIEGRG